MGKGKGIGERHGWKKFRCDRDLVLDLYDLEEGTEVAVGMVVGVGLALLGIIY